MLGSTSDNGAPIRRKRRKFSFGRAPPRFGSKSTISRFGERFRHRQYSLVSFLFAAVLLTVPPCPMESAPLLVGLASGWLADAVLTDKRTPTGTKPCSSPDVMAYG